MPPAESGPEDRDQLREQLFIAARTQRRDVRRLPRLLRESAQLVWRTDRRATAATTVLQLSGAAVAALQVLLAGLAVSALLDSGGDIDGSLVLPLALLALVTLIGSLASNASSLLGRLLSLRVERRITDEVLGIATGVRLVRFDDPGFYNQLSRVLSNVPVQPYQVVTSLASLLGGLLGSGALVVTLVVLSPTLALILVVSGAPLWLIARRTGRMEFDFAVRQTANARERQYVVDLLTRREGAAEARAYATSDRLRARHDAFYETFLADSAALVRRRYALAAGSATVTAVTLGVALVVLFLLVDADVVSLSQAAAGVIAIRLLSSRITLLLGGVATLFQSSLFLDDYDRFTRDDGYEAPADVAPGAAPAPTPERRPRAQQAAGIELVDVGFRYPAAEHDAVHGLNLSIEPDTVVALVGENGSGKTTLAKLMAGLYEPSAGEVVWRDHDGHRVEADAAVEDVALVLQEFARYQYSVRENIELGRPGGPVTPDAVERAVDSAGMTAAVTRLPQEFETRLSRQFDGGRELSVGQWQRLALARAFYRDGSVVILDEPAAALDPRAEQQLYQTVRQLLHGRTVVFITHRMQSVRGADRIIVLHEGQVVEDGGHDELMAAGGLYAELVGLQQDGGLGTGGRGLDES